MIPVAIVSIFGAHDGPTWDYLEKGDGLSYPDGALYVVEERVLEDRVQVTYLMRCVVPRQGVDEHFNDSVILSRPRREAMPPDVSIVKSA